ncbi:hypothetical protein [Brachybacterium sp. UNK5269]|uniref:hypothetical protein n=1 Tax=Brachybacterium sp. UNK5269 TaxID=3408576 RepID=UPI003BB1B088
MDEADRERWADGPAPGEGATGRRRRPAAPDEEPLPLRPDPADRVEEDVSAPGGEERVRVRWLTPAGRAAVQAEMQLLAALEVAGIRAAPDVLEVEDDGYVRETAPPLVRGTGRRAAESGAPAIGERLALARAREDLDALVDALHERGWVLGAPAGRGVGLRADGSAVLVDLHGLRREEGVAAQRRDRSWVGTVLQDEQRTLRRRVHAASSAPFARPLDLPMVDAPGSAPRVAAAAPGEPGREAPGQVPDPPAPAPAATLPIPRASRSRAAERSAGDAGGGSRPRSRAVLPGALEALAPSRRRRTAALTAALGLTVAAVVAASTWWLSAADPGPAAGEEPALTAPPSGSAPAPPSEAVPVSAPAIEDPWELAAELAGARHSYLTGLSDRAVAVPGSATFAVDQQVRAAYRGIEVRGGGPVVHEADLLTAPGQDGIAVLSVVTSTAAHELVEPDGTLRRVPATEPVRSELSVQWDGSSWRVLSVSAADD